MLTTFIYALKAPHGAVRYIGKANNPEKRFREHFLEARRVGNQSYKNRWFRKLLKEGQIPRLEILDEVPVTEWKFWEQEYIRLLKMVCYPLVNGTAGGEGGEVFLTPESRAAQSKKRSAALIGRIMSPEWRDRIRQARLGKKHSVKSRELIGRASLGRTHSAETRLKMTRSKLSYWANRKNKTCKS